MSAASFFTATSLQKQANLVWLRDDYISPVCTVSLRRLKVLASFCFYIKYMCEEKAACVPHAGDLFHWLFLLTEGKLDLTKDGLRHLTIEPGNMFGELALLYDCTHTFSVTGTERPRAGGSFFFFIWYLHTGVTETQLL